MLISTFLFWLATVDLVITVLLGLRLVWATRSLGHLKHVPPYSGSDLPRVSIIVAARNEERNIEKALTSLLQLDYDKLEVIVIDDRSTDGTAAILDRLAANVASLSTDGSQAPGASLRVVHLSELPPGWLGKNHALYCGAREATGEYLLFTDADIVMDRSVLRRAIAYARKEQIDHLALFFRVSMPSWLLESFAIAFTLYFIAHFKPWKVRDPHSPAHIGIGGFNLLRAEAYRQLGTHEALAMRPDDDVKLGKLVKKHGLRQDLLLAPDLIYVPWYSSVRELLVGLEKNAFAGVDYSISMTVASSLAILALHAFPFLAILVTSGWTRWLFIAEVLLLLALAANTAHQGRWRMSAILGFPLAVTMFAFVQWRTMILNLWQGGIRWRDTFYPLAELKANRI